jgi:hypothetical protein
MRFLPQRLPIHYRNIQDSTAFASARASVRWNVETKTRIPHFAAIGAFDFSQSK